jgi:hypothetical protein
MPFQSVMTARLKGVQEAVVLRIREPRNPMDSLVRPRQATAEILVVPVPHTPVPRLRHAQQQCGDQGRHRKVLAQHLREQLGFMDIEDSLQEQVSSIDFGRCRIVVTCKKM